MAAIFSAIALFCSIVVLARGHPQNRIVGGTVATEGQFPHQVSLRMNGRHICGGSVISPKYVLTAAHCVTDVNENGEIESNDPESFTILVGTVNRLSGGQEYQVNGVKIHEAYGEEYLMNDVALLELSEPLNFSKTVQAIALASAETPEDMPITISGWGRLETNGEVPVELQFNVLKSISKVTCLKKIGFYTDELLCLAHAKDNGACNGDSGGPAVYNGELVGVAGFVAGGCGSSLPDGYANVSYHKAWIRENSDLEEELQ